jgi:hypothetical protein
MPLLANINVGSAPNDGTGANLRSAFTTVNENFQFVEAFFPNTSNIALTANIDSTGTSTFNNVTVSNLTVSNNFIVGTLPGLTLSGNLIGTSIQAATIGNAGSSLTGTLATAAQPNITSIGTLTSLGLSGTLSGTTVEAATIGNTGSSLIGTLTSASQTNITSVGQLSSLSIAANASVLGANLTVGRVTGLLRTVNHLIGSNTTAFSIPFNTNTATQLHSLQINANCTISYTSVFSGLQHFMTVKNVSGSTANIILPNANNNKVSNVIPVTTNSVASFIFTSFDTTSSNVTVTVISS